MKFIVSALVILLVASCTKGFLTDRVSSQYELADNLNNLAGLFNNDDLMAQTPVMGEQSGDDHYMTDNFFNKLKPEDQNIYIWKKEIFEGKTGIPDWDLPYSQIFTANLVLDGLKKITPGAVYQQQWNEIKGNALFFRSYALFNLLQVFAKAYDSTTADKDFGLPIPLEANTEIIPARSSIKETYRRIIADLTEALPLVIPTISPLIRNKPNKPAVYALLARVYLSMRNYSLAMAFADSSLHYQSKLIDYKTLDVDEKYPITATNEETLYQSWLITTSNVIQGKVVAGVII
ncbi:MAG TPA: RagB/SusD family nutrient uptake outer membrane protein, partial [Niastella sp.]